MLSALILVSARYTVTTPTIMYGVLGLSPMKHFGSIDDLKNYLNTNSINTYSYYSQNFGDAPRVKGDVPQAINAPAPEASSLTASLTSTATDFSKTNVQVAGVDEADIVKTDDQYIYTLHKGSTESVQILNADPKSPQIVGKITFGESTFISGMYLSENANVLAVLGSTYQHDDIIPLYDSKSSGSSEPMSTALSSIYWQIPKATTFIYVYDVSNKASPVLTRNMTLSGDYVNSRMVGDYVYLIVNQVAAADDVGVILPRASVDAVITETEPTSIYYTDVQDTYFSYTVFNGINIINETEQPTSMTILMGASSCMYVSNGNMYVTFNKHDSTELYRVAFNGADFDFKAQGTVSGYVLNQYSMDEYNNYFRIATTAYRGGWANNLYVLNMNLETVGKLENLAKDELIYSARFAGDKAYLVTFRQIDPFFVLDLKKPNAPKVAGELKIPGFSNYLHPYSENYVIGLGREDNAIKLSLFDVTDMNNPQEIAKYLIDENNASISSEALYEPKAFMFDQQKQLLVIPISITNYSKGGTDGSNVKMDQIDLWSGVYAFKVSTENGFTLQNKISHKPPESNQNGYNPVTRSLYIGNTLYTISNDMIQLNSLDGFRLIAKVTF